MPQWDEGSLMAERKTEVQISSGEIVEGVDVPISESIERWSELTLDDGAIIRVKMTVAQAFRVDGQFDQEGNPVYVLKSTSTIALVSVPEELRKKVQ